MKVKKADIKRICKYLELECRYSGNNRKMYVDNIPNDSYGDWLRHVLKSFHNED
jgi:hypothetical protein